MLQNGDKAMTLCFVEFVDSKCALTALEALQGRSNIFFFFGLHIIKSYIYAHTVLRKIGL